jgi:hypothetical protein
MGGQPRQIIHLPIKPPFLRLSVRAVEFRRSTGHGASAALVDSERGSDLSDHLLRAFSIEDDNIGRIADLEPIVL